MEDDDKDPNDSFWSVSSDELLELRVISPPGSPISVENPDRDYVQAEGSSLEQNSSNIDDPSKRRKFKFQERRSLTEALTLPDRLFKALFRMSKDTFYKLYQEFWHLFPEGEFFLTIMAIK